MDGIKITALYLGRIECKRFRLIDDPDEEKMLKVPITAILIEHPVYGKILYDTGNTDDFERVYPHHVLEDYPIVEQISITDALKEHGLTPYDIDMLILSHLHFDHAGGLKYFANTPAGKAVIVSEADLANAFVLSMSGEGGAYEKAVFDIPGIVFKPIKEDLELSDDLKIFIQKSHTPGLLGLIAKTKNSGNFIVPCDSVYIKESFEKETPPGGTINKTTDEFFDNLEKIRNMKEELNAELICGHDYEQMMKFYGKTIE